MNKIELPTGNKPYLTQTAEKKEYTILGWFNDSDEDGNSTSKEVSENAYSDIGNDFTNEREGQ